MSTSLLKSLLGFLVAFGIRSKSGASKVPHELPFAISPVTVPSFQFIPDISLLSASGPLHMLFPCWEHSFFLPQAFPSHSI